MHELALGQAILDHVELHAGGQPVARVDVRIGHLRQVVPDSLQFAWQMLTEDTPLAGCRLVVEHVPAVVRCRHCGVDTTLRWPILACEACERHDVDLLSGEELQIASLDLSSREVG